MDAYLGGLEKQEAGHFNPAHTPDPLRRILLRLPRGHRESTMATRKIGGTTPGAAGSGRRQRSGWPTPAYDEVFLGRCGSVFRAPLKIAGSPGAAPLLASTGVNNPD